MFAHVHLALLIVLFACLLGRMLRVPPAASAWFGVAGTAAVCLTREMTQREYQWIEAFGGGLRRNMPWYAGYEIWQWNAHSIGETLVAILVATVLACAITLWSRRRGQAKR